MGRLFIASKLNTQKLRMIFAVLLLLAPSVFAQCGVGSQCKTKVGVETCTPCPAGTSCSQWTTSSGSLGAFYCLYTLSCRNLVQPMDNKLGKFGGILLSVHLVLQEPRAANGQQAREVWGHFTVSTPCAWLRGLFVTIELAHAVLAWSAVRQVRQQWHRPAITLQQQQPQQQQQQPQLLLLLPLLLQQPLPQQF